MSVKLVATLSCVVLAFSLSACQRTDAIKEHQAFCKAREALYKVEQTGTVGAFGPAMKKFADSMPQAASKEIRGTAKEMSSSWNEVYSTYAESGGDPDVKLQVKKQIPPEIAGMNAEWIHSLDRTKVRKVYDFADSECESTKEGS